MGQVGLVELQVQVAQVVQLVQADLVEQQELQEPLAQVEQLEHLVQQELVGQVDLVEGVPFLISMFNKANPIATVRPYWATCSLYIFDKAIQDFRI